MNKVKTIWKNKALIWKGFLNTVFKKDPVEKIYYKRLMVCNDCPLLDLKGNKCLMPGTQPCCGECGCSLALKLRSPEAECTHPDGPKWKEVKL